MNVRIENFFPLQRVSCRASTENSNHCRSTLPMKNGGPDEGTTNLIESGARPNTSTPQGRAKMSYLNQK